jgi:hypothetical protein
MITPLERRLYKEAVIQLLRHLKPQFQKTVAELPHTFVSDSGGKAADTMTMGEVKVHIPFHVQAAPLVRAINFCEELPWPKEHGLLIGAMKGTGGTGDEVIWQSWCLLREPDDSSVRHFPLPRGSDRDHLIAGDFAFAQILGPNNHTNAVDLRPIGASNSLGAAVAHVMLSRQEFSGPLRKKWLADVRGAVRCNSQWVDRTCKQHGIKPDDRNRIYQWVQSQIHDFHEECVRDCDKVWAATSVAYNPHTGKPVIVDEDSVVDAMAMLVGFSPLVDPARYIVVNTKLKNGFGNPSIKKKTKNKKVCAFISADRVYDFYGQTAGGNANGGASGKPRKAHRRRAHWRYLWHQAGIDRKALPQEPAERYMLAETHKVERVFIHATWVGETKKEEVDCTHEVQKGEGL